jgi:hypothetical protein
MTFNPNAGAINCQGLVTDATDVLAASSTMSYTHPFNAIAQFAVVAWESSDLSSFSPLSAPLHQQVATSTSSEGDGTSLSTANTNHVAPSNGLPQNTKIGLGVGIPCGGQCFVDFHHPVVVDEDEVAIGCARVSPDVEMGDAGRWVEL